ncbi:beta-ketoacyl-[acyl-carrier-protein] synthase family protein [Streptacidiphilus sp. NEAU-YB345]|uniref:Beta-ketoacyl-[acyl-carrier-protein] synthase family protein n=1 Tax=Streptacidiphilus fuscans TaxID=2789292 RepID=A0A931FD49_9ACTN|nr:beta-ketoacyl-[acyl-carrier-protein] synthase family protein [Streptacidiphilus fuscans]
MQAPPYAVAVTGLGLISAAGVGVAESWSAVTRRTRPTGVRRPEVLAGLPTDFMYLVDDDPAQALDVAERRLTERFAQLAVLAAREAVADAGLDPADPTQWDGQRVAVLIGNANGALPLYDAQHATLLERGHRRVSPMLPALFNSNCAAAAVCRDLGARGPSMAVTSTCASGADAIGLARQLLRAGMCDIAIAGGAESACSRMLMAGLCKTRALSTHRQDPAAACRPFDAGRDGFVVGEGAGLLVLERPEHARARGARVRARLVGYGSSNDAYAPVAAHPDGLGAEQALRGALAEAGVTGADIGHVNAHGTATVMNDQVEAAMLRRVLGEQALVTSTKAMTGHTLGAAGGIESVFTVLALEHQLVPPTANLDSLDPDIPVDVVAKEARPARFDHAVKTSLGFGGHNAALVFARA